MHWLATNLISMVSGKVAADIVFFENGKSFFGNETSSFPCWLWKEIYHQNQHPLTIFHFFGPSFVTEGLDLLAKEE